MKLPNKLIEDLNNAGFGGRVVYVPMGKRNASMTVLAHMTDKLKSGEDIDLDDYKNTLSMPTLYRLKKKALNKEVI